MTATLSTHCLELSVLIFQYSTGGPYFHYRVPIFTMKMGTQDPHFPGRIGTWVPILPEKWRSRVPILGGPHFHVTPAGPANAGPLSETLRIAEALFTVRRMSPRPLRGPVQ